LIRVEQPRLIVERLEWKVDQAQFALAKSEEFERTANGWARRSG